MSQYDFTNPPSRAGTGSLKWTAYLDRDVLPLWVADMDFQSAPEILHALRERVDHGIFGYTLPDRGVEEAVLHYLSNTHGIEADPSWLCWLPGLVPALNVVSQAIGEAGDAVMTCTPVYPPFLSAPKNQTRELITVPLCRRDDRWTFAFAAMEAAVTPRTKLFILCNPHNPIGRVFSRAELLELTAFCERHNLTLCSDEIHCDLILDDVPHIATATLGDAVAERTISLFAPSKTYNLPGLSCAYAVISNPTLRTAFRRAAQGYITEVNCFGYTGCEAAYRHGEPWRQALLAVLRQNREQLYTFVAENLPEITIHPMEATYLAWMDFRKYGLENPAAHVESHGLALSDGRLFGNPGWLRLNFGCSPTLLEQALERLHRAMTTKSVSGA